MNTPRPHFQLTPLVETLVGELSRSDELSHKALASVCKQGDLTQQEVAWQTGEILSIRAQSLSNGQAIEQLEKLKLVEVVEQHNVLVAAHDVWARRKKSIIAAGTALIFIVGPLLSALAKRIAETLFP